jgi:hypothetical protein
MSEGSEWETLKKEVDDIVKERNEIQYDRFRQLNRGRSRSSRTGLQAILHFLWD